MKKQLSHLALLVFLGISITGCTTVHDALYGRIYQLEVLAKANLGITKKDEITQGFGDPFEINQRWFDSYEAEVYFYQAQYNNPDGGNTVAFQTLACEFSKGVLTAYRLHDTAPSAQQDFNESERAKLVKGSSTQAEVQRLLGAPMGKALLPSTITQASLGYKLGGATFPLAKFPQEAREVWQYYSEAESAGGVKTAQKTLSVFFDAKGVFIGSTQLQELAIRP